MLDNWKGSVYRCLQVCLKIDSDPQDPNYARKNWLVGLSSKLNARALTHLHTYILWKDKQINKETHFESFNGKYTHQKGTKNKGAYMYPSTWDYQEDIYEFHSMQQDPSQKPSNFCKGRYISHKNVKINKPNSHLNLYLFFEISMHVPGADCVEDMRQKFMWF